MKTNFYVTKIHNNSVSSLTKCESEEEAKNLIRNDFAKQFDRPMNDEETDDLEDFAEVKNDEDFENVYTFSIDTIEEPEDEMEKENREADEYKTFKRCQD